MNEISNKELSSYLQEINAEEAAELPQDLTGNKAWSPWTTLKDGIPEQGIKTKLDFIEGAKRTNQINAEKKAERQKKRREIFQSALSDRFIDLNVPLSVENKKLLIQLETAKYTEKMKFYEQRINFLFQTLALHYLPKVVKACWDYYPKVIVPMEPFTYQASEDFGNGFQFRVSIEAPSYYTHNEFLEKVNTKNPNTLISIDKIIVKFYRCKDARSKNEVIMADKLLSMKSFYDLLQQKPFWYETLINKLKENSDVSFTK